MRHREKAEKLVQNVIGTVSTKKPGEVSLSRHKEKAEKLAQEVIDIVSPRKPGEYYASYYARAINQITTERDIIEMEMDKRE